jgi:type I restriction enzyme, S subunit
MIVMEGWKQYKLGELANSYAGGTPSRDHAEYFGGSIPWIKSTEINHKKINTTEETISEQGYRSSSAKWIPASSVLIAMYGATAAQVSFLEIEATANQAVLAVVPSDKLDARFLFHVLTDSKSKLLFLAQGSGQPNLNKQIVDDLVIYLPSLVEQKQIAKILSTIDQAIAQTEAIIAKQQRIKTGLMQDLLTKGIDEAGNVRSEATHEFKDSAIGRIPVEWEVEKVGDVFDMQLGKMLSQKSIEGKALFPYLANRNVQWDYVDISEIPEMNFSLEERKKFELLENDILICEGGEIGRTCLWRMELENCYFQKAIHRLRPKKKEYLSPLFPRYIRYLLSTGTLNNFTSQTSIAHLTKEKLANVPIAVPRKSEQQKIIEILDRSDDLLRNEENKLKKLNLQKNGLMQDLLTGKVRVTALLPDPETPSP